MKLPAFLLATAALGTAAANAPDGWDVALWVLAMLCAGVTVALLFDLWQPVPDPQVDERHDHRPETDKC